MVVFQAILPIFGLIMLGYLLGWRKWLAGEAAAGLANITFKLFMPAVLFTGIARAQLSDGMSPTLLLAYFGPVVTVCSPIARTSLPPRLDCSLLKQRAGRHPSGNYVVGAGESGVRICHSCVSQPDPVFPTELL